MSSPPRLLAPAFLLCLGMALPSQARAQADLAAGEKLFQQRCAVCHSLTAAQRKPTGPHLEKLFGRKSAGDPDYGYSTAMQAVGLVWSDKSLDDYLANPSRIVPGTSMPLAVPQAADREDIIAYLKAQPK